jgi:hypothetical protein
MVLLGPHVSADATRPGCGVIKEASAQLVAAAETLANEAISARLAELAGLAGDRETAADIANRSAEGVNVVTAESIWIPRQEFLEM